MDDDAVRAVVDGAHLPGPSLTTLSGAAASAALRARTASTPLRMFSFHL